MGREGPPLGPLLTEARLGPPEKISGGSKKQPFKSAQNRVAFGWTLLIIHEPRGHSITYL